MTRRVSALYRSRELADTAAARLSAAGLGGETMQIAEQGPAEGAQSGVFDKLATMLAPDGTRPDGGFRVSLEVASEQIEAAAVALEAGADRVEIAPPPRLAEQLVELSETAEELVIEKQAVVREEIVMRVQAKQMTEEVRATVRRSEVEVERFGPDGVATEL